MVIKKIIIFFFIVGLTCAIYGSNLLKKYYCFYSVPAQGIAIGDCTIYGSGVKYHANLAGKFYKVSYNLNAIEYAGTTGCVQGVDKERQLTVKYNPANPKDMFVVEANNRLAEGVAFAFIGYILVFWCLQDIIVKTIYKTIYKSGNHKKAKKFKEYIEKTMGNFIIGCVILLGIGAVILIILTAYVSFTGNSVNDIWTDIKSSFHN